MAFWSVILTGLIFLWELFKDWLALFISPFKNPEILWIIIPIWISWFFAEFFQEKKGTSFGNAISNGIIPIFIGIDWTRYLTNQLTTNIIKWSYIVIIKYSLSGLMIIYGFSIVFFGIKARQFVHFYGRIREVTYVLLVFSPIVYNIVELNWKFLLGIVLFFPLYYYLIEFINRQTPNPKIYQYDEGQQPGQQSAWKLNASSNFRKPPYKLP